MIEVSVGSAVTVMTGFEPSASRPVFSVQPLKEKTVSSDGVVCTAPPPGTRTEGGKGASGNARMCLLPAGQKKTCAVEYSTPSTANTAPGILVETCTPEILWAAKVVAARRKKAEDMSRIGWLGPEGWRHPVHRRIVREL